MRAAHVFSLLALAACAPPEDNAVLLIRMRLPYADGDLPYASVQVNRDDERFAFDETWVTPTPHVVDLRQEPEFELAIRTDAPGDEALQHVRVRVLLCATKTACGSNATTPELQFLLEQPFYAGQLTEWVAAPGAQDGAMPDSVLPSAQEDMPRAGEPPLIIDRCSIAGCVERAGRDFTLDPENGFCRMVGKKLVHFCEDG